MHQDDGPAVEYTAGYKAWYVNGKLHRTDGPAVGCPGEYEAWYICGEPYTEEEFTAITEHMMHSSPKAYFNVVELESGKRVFIPT